MRSRFTDFFTEFRKTETWKAMVNTKEDSPWHREESTAIHTQMLLDWYNDNLYSSRNDNQRMITSVAALMHDIGKPSSQILKHSEERGDYKAYHGHEQVSARMWVDYAMTNLEMVKETLRFDLSDISNIALMLEHHVPYGLKDKKKRSALKGAFTSRMGDAGHRAWLDLLLSDSHGRISDDQVTKLAAVDVWMIEWEKV